MELNKHAALVEREIQLLQLRSALSKLFQAVDTNHDDRIDRKTFGDFMTKLGLNTQLKEALLAIAGLEECEYTDERTFIARFEGVKLEDQQALPNISSDVFNRKQSQELCSSTADPLKFEDKNNRMQMFLTHSQNKLDVQRRSQTLKLPQTVKFDVSPIVTDVETPRNRQKSCMKIAVFLGGTCGDSTWRSEIVVPMLMESGISFYNPQVQAWQENLLVLENLMKSWCRFLLFVINASSRSCASMVEAAALIAEERNIVLVIEDVQCGSIVNGEVIGVEEANDLNRGRKYLRVLAAQYNVIVYNTAQAGCRAIIETYQREKSHHNRDSSSSSNGSVGFYRMGSTRMLALQQSIAACTTTATHRRQRHSI